MSVKRSAATSFVLITVLIDSIGFGVIIPVLPRLISELAHVDISGAARYGGWLFAAYSVMQFLFSPVMGGLSDQYGRRPVLLASLFGFGLDYLLLVFAPNIGWLFVGRIIAGVMGASFTTAAAYMADISTPDKRAQNFGMIGAAFGLGFIIGPSIGGFVSHLGTRAPFMVAGGLTILNWLYGYFVLPESLSIENRRKFNWKRANPIGALMSIRRFPMITGLVGALFLVYISNFSTQGTWTYFTKEKFNWTEQEVGFSLTFIGVMIAFVQGFLTRLVIPKLGTRNAIYVGFAFSIFGSVAYCFANEGWMVYAIMVPFALGGLAGPAMQGIISGQVPPNEQGELQGSLTSLNSVASIIGPVLMTGLFYRFTEKGAPVYFPGVPFLAAAILTTISLILIIKTLRKHTTKVEQAESIKH
ncbi:MULTISPECIES: TCR/Tet family MFS transporter [unclassified Emticicia]|uniref:TCR/Tet family MFS transporter n=1 Tax=unclassified Emticicia TaxID=2627301 RepID=UPI000C764EB1|nr:MULTISPECIES: TCR/Tet family MFS transporter [unclassified Emticicia]PLK42404.1 tetracycline resistance MFS efflux pump [Emticicia sp. TH156]UTA67300.1 TCR/Tet family MFS transporter [Emticicia sp. 21SJ11W-3]